VPLELEVLGDELGAEPAVTAAVEIATDLVGALGDNGAIGPVGSIVVVEAILGVVGAVDALGGITSVLAIVVELIIGGSGPVLEAIEVLEDVRKELVELRILIDTNGGGLNLEGEVLLLDDRLNGRTSIDSLLNIGNDGVLDSLVSDLGNKGSLGGSGNILVVLLVDFLDLLGGLFHNILDLLGGLRSIELLLDDLSSLILGIIMMSSISSCWCSWASSICLISTLEL